MPTGIPRILAFLHPLIALAAIADERVTSCARVLVLGPGALRPADVDLVDDPERATVDTVAWLDTGGPERWELGRVQESCGRAALAALARGASLAQRGVVAALVTGPVSKEALHAAGERVEVG